MADLSKRELPRNARRRLSDNADFLGPSRRDTSRPGLEVNAPLVGGNNSRAQALLDILNVGTKAAQQGVDYLDEKEAEKRQVDRASGANAGLTGKPDEAQLAKSRAYAQGYYLSGAQRTLIETQQRVQEAILTRLNDATQDPATPEDIHTLINDEFAKVALNEDGTTRNFGDPLAAQAMANGLAKIREAVVPDALTKIKEQTDDHLIGNLMFNLAHGVGLKELGHEEPPAGLTLSSDGVPKPGAIKSIDPNTALGNAPVEVKGVAKLTTGRLPIQGTITSSYKAHLGRGSHGLDIDGFKGQPVEAPATGKVVQASFSPQSGNFIILDHGNGVMSSYAHLGARYFKVGQTVQAGDTLGVVGNTGHVVAEGGGDGSHLHYRVRVHGKDVDPATFSFKGVAAPSDSGGPSLQPAQSAVASPVTPTAYDFEPIMAQKPPGMDPKTFKTKAIDALIVHADQANRPDILEGMAMSRRKDGTPSFSPEEILKLNDTADQLRNKHYAEAQRQERELHQANEDTMLEAFVTDNPPSISQVQDWTQKGLISARFGYTMVNTIQSQQHQDEVEAHQMVREAKADAEREADEFATAEIVKRQYGGFQNAADPMDLYDSGKLGTGKAALRRLQQIRAANKAGAAEVLKGPEGPRAVAILDAAFPEKGPMSVLASAGIAATDDQGTSYKTLRANVMASLQAEIEKGTPPIEAAQKVKKEWLPQLKITNDREALEAARNALKAKAAQP